MDGMLSQDEINALLNGVDSDGAADNVQSDDDTVTVGSQKSGGSEIDETLLTADEKDAIGEIANISMGSSATTLYSLVSRKVNITTPTVALANWQTVIDDYEKPCVFIQIKYTVGLDGSNILVLKEHDVKVITDLMMGGDGTNTDGELGELHLSAISEAMNQMMGAAATSLSTMLGTMIDISPPDATLIDVTEFASGEEISPFLGGTFAKVVFRMQIDDLVDSKIMQLYPIDFAKSLYDTFISGGVTDTQPSAPAAAPAQQPAPAPMPTPTPMQAMPQMDPSMGMNPNMQMGMGMPQMNMGQMGMPMMGAVPQMQNMNIQPVQFQNFSNDFNPFQSQENMNLIMDVPLEVTVELGRTRKNISDILDFAPGTIIELDKIAGEPIDVLVNGKFVAKGEVVVIEESFAIRVTEIIK
ncbi:MAG: flagellar motor switch phosphatase FliY [Lachnospiraceae bacterium]|nr:flagellar motor switch phosphatase FliY [Lachnospiraceae bacterium]